MKKLIAVMLLFGLYYTSNSDSDSSSSSLIGYKSESSYGWQDGKGI